MKNIAKVFLMVCIFCPVLSAAEPGGAANAPRVSGQRQNRQQIERRQQRLERRMNLTRADANQQEARSKEFAQWRLAREKQISDEFVKNKKRIIILTRIKELAEATNQPQKAQKADSLIQMENQRHRQRIIRLQTQSAAPVNKLEETEPNNK